MMEVLVTAIDQAFDKKSWHGTNLRGSIRGVTFEEAAWRPAPNRHNIWEIVLHAAYWKYVVRRRILNEKRGSFPLKGSDWFTPEDVSDAAWKRDVRLLLDVHRSMRGAVIGLDAQDLSRKPSGRKVDNLSLLTGISAHDLYHAGQIQLLKRLGAKWSRTRTTV